MTKIFILILKLSLLAAIAVGIARYPGQVFIYWMDYRFEMEIGILLVILIILTAILIFLANLWRGLWHFPTRWIEWRKKCRKSKGRKAIIDGINALAAGELNEAKQLSLKALELSDDRAFSLLLAAQAAYLKGDTPEAETFFTEMTRQPETRFLGLRGLILQSQQSRNWSRTRDLLHQAFEVRPHSPWVMQHLLALDLRLGFHEQSDRLIHKLETKKIISRQEGKRKRALFYWLRAEQALVKGDQEEFYKLSLKSHSSAPDLVGIAVRLADFLHKRGQIRKARKILMATWQHHPHPDIGEALAHLNHDASPLESYKILEEISASKLDDSEARFTLAKAALAAHLWGQARQHLQILMKQAYTARVCRLMAAVEESEHHNLLLAKEWWNKVVTAPADPAWTCTVCHSSQPSWQVFCDACGAFDSLAWQIASHAPPLLLKTDSIV